MRTTVGVLTDWSFWDEDWFPTAVYATALACLLLGIGYLIFGATANRAIRFLTEDPVVTIGGLVALIGVVGTLKSSDGAPQLAAIVGGLALVVIRFVGPRIESVKYRDLEILLAKAEEAKAQGDEETSRQLYQSMLDLISPTDATGTGDAASSAKPSSRLRVKGDIDRWFETLDRGRKVASSGDRALEYEHFVAQQLSKILPKDATFAFPKDRPYDILITRGSHRAAVDVRLGANFRAREFAERIFGDYSLQDTGTRPSFYLLIVDEEPDSARLDALMREVSSYKIPTLLTALGLPMREGEDPDLDELATALAPLLI